jgi:hypothetical protein
VSATANSPLEERRDASRRSGWDGRARDASEATAGSRNGDKTLIQASGAESAAVKKID